MELADVAGKVGRTSAEAAGKTFVRSFRLTLKHLRVNEQALAKQNRKKDDKKNGFYHVVLDPGGHNRSCLSFDAAKVGEWPVKKIREIWILDKSGG